MKDFREISIHVVSRAREKKPEYRIISARCGEKVE